MSIESPIECLMIRNAINLLFYSIIFVLACQPQPKVEDNHETNQTESDTLIHLTAEVSVKILPDTISSDSLARLHKRYAGLKNQVIARRNQYLERYNQAETDSAKNEILDEAGRYVRLMLVEDIFPAWYGTKWDFNGHTNKPNDGLIACGYFVSTPLKHIGAPINRYRIAQQYSLKIVNILCHQVGRYQSFEKMMTYIRRQPDDLYIIGLDNHVGYIHKSGDEIAFIHSSFIDPVAVLSEVAEESSVLTWSSIYVLGHLTSNQEFIRKWLMQEEIVVS